MAVDCNICTEIPSGPFEFDTSRDFTCMKQNLFRSTKQIRIQFSQNTSLYMCMCMCVG